MRDLFCGWKRKIGVLSLLAACLFIVLWLRSFENHESLYLTLWHFRSGVISVDSKFGIFSGHANNQASGFAWFTLPSASAYGTANGSPLPVDASIVFNVHDGNGNEFLWRRRISGFEIGLIKPVFNSTARLRFVFIPYWSLVVPLILSSTWLMLSKSPRPVVDTILMD